MTHWPRDVSAAVLALGLPASAWAGVCATDFDLGTQIGPSVSMGNTCGQGNDFGSNVPGYTVTCAAGSNTTDLSFLWTAPQTGAYQFDTNGSSYDTAIQIRAEIDCGMTELDCDDDGGIGTQSALTYDLIAGEQIVLVVDGYSGTVCGDYVLNIVRSGCLDVDADAICDDVDPCIGNNATGDTDVDGICDDNDACLGDDATGDFDNDGTCDDLDATCDITTTDLGSALGPFVATGTTVGGGADFVPANPGLSCGYTFSGLAEDVEFSWTAPFTGQFAFVLPSPAGITYDTVLWALDDACNQIACDDDYPGSTRSSIVMDLTAGQTITLIVDGYNLAVGDFSLAILPTSNAGLTIDTPVAAGATVQWTILGARPNADYRLYFSRPGATAGNPTPFPGGPSSTLDFPKGVTQGVVGPEGTFEVFATAPANLPAGLPFTFQAVYWDGSAGGVTNVAGTISQ